LSITFPKEEQRALRQLYLESKNIEKNFNQK